MFSNPHQQPLPLDSNRRNNSLLLQDNCYYHTNWNAEVPTGVKKTNPADYKSGALCYQLNGSRKDGDMVWYQTLTVDPFPIPDSRHKPVYMWDDGTYHNDDEDAITPIAHSILNMEHYDNAVYDLSGRKVVNGSEFWVLSSGLEDKSPSSILNSHLPKGLYIINGRKVLVK